MSILSFNQARRDHLLQQAETAHQRRHFREAYDFLREALRYGENADIFHRAATILNEMGEYAGAAQVAQYALKADPRHSMARWELAVASERLWKLEDALLLFEELAKDDSFSSDARILARKSLVAGMCHLKRMDLAGARKAMFRGAGKGELPQPLATRIERLEAFMSHDHPTQPGLRDWMNIMHGHFLLKVCSRENPIQIHVSPSQAGMDSFGGEHFVTAHPSFQDCARALMELKRWVSSQGSPYCGVYACEPQSIPVAMAVGQLLGLPRVDVAKLSSSDRVLLCLASNAGKMGTKIGRHWHLRHDLFILARSFEREEFHDVVSPPHHQPMVHAWAEPIVAAHRQVLGMIGEFISLPWEQASIKARETMKISSDVGLWDPISADKEGDVRAIADRLLRACDPS